MIQTQRPISVFSTGRTRTSMALLDARYTSSINTHLESSKHVVMTWKPSYTSFAVPCHGKVSKLLPRSKNMIIPRRKADHLMVDLYIRFPNEFGIFLNYTQALRFDDKPITPICQTVSVITNMIGFSGLVPGQQTSTRGRDVELWSWPRQLEDFVYYWSCRLFGK